MTKKKLEWIDWDEKKKRFIDEKGLELRVQIVKPPVVYETSANAGNPLNFQIDDYARKAARGTDANAFRGYGDIKKNHEFPDARWSPASITIELYKIINRENNS